MGIGTQIIIHIDVNFGVTCSLLGPEWCAHSLLYIVNKGCMQTTCSKLLVALNETTAQKFI